MRHPRSHAHLRPGRHTLTVRQAHRTVLRRSVNVAGELLISWAQAAAPNRPLPVGQLGGLDITGTLLIDRYDRSQTVQFALSELPADPGRRTVLELAQQPVGMIRQLEHRVATLDELQRPCGAGHPRCRAARRQRDALARPAGALLAPPAHHHRGGRVLFPADRSQFAHESDSDLQQLADEALTGARALYTAAASPRPGAAHHAAHQVAAPTRPATGRNWPPPTAVSAARERPAGGGGS